MVWQPDAIKKDVLQHVVNEISRSSPYDLTMGQVSGNIFTGIYLHDIHVLAKADHSEVLRAKAIKIGISWWALLHKTIRINRLDWTEPTVHLLINQEGHFVSPFSFPSSSHEAIPFTYSIKDLTVEGGRVVLQNRSLSPVQDLADLGYHTQSASHDPRDRDQTAFHAS